MFACCRLFAVDKPSGIVIVLCVSWDRSVIKVISTDWMVGVSFLTRAAVILLASMSNGACEAVCLG